MARFFVRVCFPYQLCLDMLADGKDPVLMLKDELPAECSPELLYNRYTFGLFRIEAESQDGCREVFSEAWDRVFCHPCPTVFTVRDDGDDGSELMRSIFAGYYGADEYLSLIVDLYGSIPILRQNGALEALRRRSYILACDPGCGFTTLLSSFGNFLDRMHVYEDEAETRKNYTEYITAKETGGGCASPDDLIASLRDPETVSSNNVIGIDIGYFLEGAKYDELRKFARRLDRSQNDYVFVFRVPFLEKKALDEVISVLSDVMLVRTVRVPPLHDAVLLEQLWDEFYRMGYKFDHALTDAFFERVRSEKKDGRFYGFKTVAKIAHSIILEKASSDARIIEGGGSADSAVIRPSDLRTSDGKTEKDGFAELADLIGMEQIAERIREITAQVRLAMRDEKLDRPCIHMRFTGAPGTGKTTVARIIGKIFREAGILRKGAFLEYSARALCAEYVGQTAVRTASICRDAYGSVLFLDEAYSLYEGGPQNNDYGKEALTTLISEMENHRDDMLVIMAGYTDDMETLMQGNAGLRSRMPYVIHFPNYTRKQLHEIFMLMVKKHFDYEPELEKASYDYFMALPEDLIGSREFSNGRYVRNLYERTWSKGSLRATLDGTDRIRLTKADFCAASSEPEFSEAPKKTATVGFR